MLILIKNSISYAFLVWTEHLWTNCICLSIVIPKFLKWLSCVQRHVEESCLLTCIIYFLQETSLLLGNLVDVLEEIKLAKIELLNLSSAAFVLESQTGVLSILSTFYQVLVWFCHEAVILKCFLNITHRTLGSHPYVRQWVEMHKQLFLTLIERRWVMCNSCQVKLLSQCRNGDFSIFL